MKHHVATHYFGGEQRACRGGRGWVTKVKESTSTSDCKMTLVDCFAEVCKLYPSEVNSGGTSISIQKFIREKVHAQSRMNRWTYINIHIYREKHRIAVPITPGKISFNSFQSGLGVLHLWYSNNYAFRGTAREYKIQTQGNWSIPRYVFPAFSFVKYFCL